MDLWGWIMGAFWPSIIQAISTSHCVIDSMGLNRYTLFFSLQEGSSSHSNLGPLHTRDREPVTGTFQALSLVEKAEPVQVRFMLRLRDQRRMWMQDGCKVYMDSYMAPNGSRFMVTWINFRNHLLEVGLTQNREDHSTPNVHNRWFILFLSCVSTCMNRASSK